MEDTSNALELKDHSVLNVKPIATYDPQSPVATEAWLQVFQTLIVINISFLSVPIYLEL